MEFISLKQIDPCFSEYFHLEKAVVRSNRSCLLMCCGQAWVSAVGKTKSYPSAYAQLVHDTSIDTFILTLSKIGLLNLFGWQKNPSSPCNEGPEGLFLCCKTYRRDFHAIPIIIGCKFSCAFITN